MSRSNVVYLFIGALLVAVAVLAYQHYEDRKQGLHINIGPNGASVEGQ
jgi:hypothetical protein